MPTWKRHDCPRHHVTDPGFPPDREPTQPTAPAIFRNRQPKDYCQLPPAERWSGWGPLGDASAAFFFEGTHADADVPGPPLQVMQMSATGCVRGGSGWARVPWEGTAKGVLGVSSKGIPGRGLRAAFFRLPSSLSMTAPQGDDESEPDLGAAEVSKGQKSEVKGTKRLRTMELFLQSKGQPLISGALIRCN